MRDLSDLAVNSITATSQAAGNMTSSNATAMTAPGTEPVDPLPDRDHQGDPHLTPIGHSRSVLVGGAGNAGPGWDYVQGADHD